MKVGIFAYNFKHWKTQAGIQNLILAGYKPAVIFAADPVELKFYKSKIRVGPRDLFLFHPRDIAEKNNVDYHVVIHNSQETANLVKQYDLDVGIILGARILKPVAFNNFKIGVLNMHPGILPENRGLDNLKWAIISKLSQGVTTHLIDKNIDRGIIVEQEKINIYRDDTLIDVHIRLQNLEQKLMISSLQKLKVQFQQIKHNSPLEKGTYHRSVPPDVESGLEHLFKEYKEEFAL